MNAPPSFSRGETLQGLPANRSLGGELEELERVCKWDMFFAEKADAEHDTCTLAHTLHIPSVEEPPRAWKRDHRENLLRLHNTMQTAHASMLSSLASSSHFLSSSRLPSIDWAEVDNFFATHFLVPGDKDGSLAVVTKTDYIQHLQEQMDSIHPILQQTNYEKLGDMNDIYTWEDKAGEYQNQIRSWAEVLFDGRDEVERSLLTFMRRQPTPKLPKFYLLAKTHKLGQGNLWKGRPIVGMSRWCTTGISKMLGVLAQILLKLDRVRSPMKTPLQDALDFLRRLEHPVCKALAHLWSCSTIDFDSLYTNLTLQDAQGAVSFWRHSFLSGGLPLDSLTPWEKTFVEIMFTRLPSIFSAEVVELLPFLEESIPWDDQPCTAHLFMAITFRLSIFLCPPLGIFRQKNSFAMGTNCAPAWANAILRSFEVKGAQALRDFPFYCRYIDDVCLMHPLLTKGELTEILRQVYPPHLPFTIGDFAKQTQINFLDVCILTLNPLRYGVGFKPTQKGTYIPWNSNNPPAHKLGWIRGELIRFLRLSSHKEFFNNAVERLILILKKLGYPRRTYEPLPVLWENRAYYLNFQNKGASKVHVIRIPYHKGISTPWGAEVGKMETKLSMIPGLQNEKIFPVMQPPPNLQKILHGKMMHSLGVVPTGRRRPREEEPLPPRPRRRTAFIEAFAPVIYGEEVRGEQGEGVGARD
jgi:hypothetical protein